MTRRFDDRDERNRGEFSGGPANRPPTPRKNADPSADFSGYYARDPHPEIGDEYARDTHHGGLGDDYARDKRWGGAGDAGDYFGTNRSGRGFGGSAAAYGGEGRRPSFRGRGPKNYRRSDEAIADDVHQALTDDDDLDATEISVHVENGEVTLSGTVTSRWAKRHAEDLAERCRGVSDVHNRLTITDVSSVPIGKASE